MRLSYSSAPVCCLFLATVAAGCGSQNPQASPQAVAASEGPTARPEGWQTSHARPSEAITAVAARGAAPSAPVVLGYFTNWAHKRPAPCRFETSKVDVSLFSHINYAFALVGVKEADGKPVTDASALTDGSRFEVIPSSPEDEPRLFGEVNALKQKKPSLRTFLSIGGWAFNDPPTAWIFSSLAETPERRGHFIRQAIAYVRAHGFDGVDIDWEFPGASERGGRAIDTTNFTALLSEFRAQMHEEATETGKPELLLTVATPAGDYFAHHQELGKIQESLNWINLMSYDYHGDWEQVTGANAPLSGEGQNIQTSVRTYLERGVPREKIVLGFATYARVFGDVDKGQPGAAARAKGPDGPCGPESLTAAQAQSWVKNGRFVGHWDAATQTPFAYSKKDRAYVSYDDARSYAAKLEFLKAQQLGGAMFWAIDLDDFSASYPLIRQVSTALGTK